MSRENERTVVERIGIRWPSMARRTVRSVLGLPPGSRVRKVMLERVARTAFLAWNRGYGNAEAAFEAAGLSE
jgi:hypothetical protein